jgi:hypothetical protein
VACTLLLCGVKLGPMKTVWLFAITSLVGLCAHAEPHLVRLNLAGSLFGVTTAEYHIPVSSAMSLGPSLTYWGYDMGDVDLQGFGVGIIGNWSLERKVFAKGWYLSPFMNYVTVVWRNLDRAVNKNFSANISLIMVGTVFGYGIRVSEWRIDLGLGVALLSLPMQVRLEASDGSTMNADLPLSTISPTADIAIGYEF